jgi:hypothetical protein
MKKYNHDETTQNKYHITTKQIISKGKKRDKYSHWSKFMIITLHKNEKNITKDELYKIRKCFGLQSQIIPNDLLRIILGYVNFPQQKMVCLEASSNHQLLFSDNVEVCTVIKKSNDKTERLEYTDFNKTIKFKGEIIKNIVEYTKCTNTKFMDDYMKNEDPYCGACNGSHHKDWPCSDLLEDLENIKMGNKKYAKSWFANIYEIFVMSNNNSLTMRSIEKYLVQTQKRICNDLCLDFSKALSIIYNNARLNDIILVTNNDNLNGIFEISLLTQKDLDNVIRELKYVYYAKNIYKKKNNNR